MFGFNPVHRDLGVEKKFSLAGTDMLVVPFAAGKKLMNIEMNSILEFVEKGGVLIIDGETPLAEKLGIVFTNRTVSATRIKELTIPVPESNCQPPVRLQAFYRRKRNRIVQECEQR